MEYINSDAPILPLPEWLLGVFQSEELSQSSPLVLPETIGQGQRNDLLFKQACKLQAQGKTDDEIALEIQKINRERCIPPLPLKEVNILIEQASAYPKGQKRYEPTDLGNSERFFDEHGRYLRYVNKIWLIWNGKKWEADTLGKVIELAKQVSRRMLEDAEKIS